MIFYFTSLLRVLELYSVLLPNFVLVRLVMILKFLLEGYALIFKVLIDKEGSSRCQG